MSLDVNKLERLVELADGVKRARCPACGEAGQDRKGEHLRIAADGKFGCCVFPGDREHRKRIFALAGERGRRSIKVVVASVKGSGVTQSGLLGRLGRVFVNPVRAASVPDASDGVKEIEMNTEETRTARTGLTKSGQTLLGLNSDASDAPSTTYAYAQEKQESDNKLIEFDQGVRSVREEKLPFLTPGGSLSIPFDSPERYHYWKGGQSVKATLAEVLERMEKEKHGDDF